MLNNFKIIAVMILLIISGITFSSLLGYHLHHHDHEITIKENHHDDKSCDSHCENETAVEHFFNCISVILKTGSSDVTILFNKAAILYSLNFQYYMPDKVFVPDKFLYLSETEFYYKIFPERAPPFSIV